MKKTILLLLALLVVLSAQSFAWRGEAGKPDRKRFEKIMMDKLELTDKQKEEFKAQMEKVEQETKPISDQIKEKADKLKDELQKDAPDRGVIYEYIRGMNSLRADMEIKRLDALLSLKAGLSPEQKKKFQDLMGRPKFFGRRGGRWQK